MSERPASKTVTARTLQVDKAEVDAAAQPATCVECQQRIAKTYFQINDRVVCPDCKDSALTSAGGGSGARRLMSAILWGGVGAIAGAALWITITRLTGYEIGLIAIVVGFLVGVGVKKGASGRGGWQYQTLAVVLTYLAIVSTYVPDIHAEVVKRGDTQQSVSTTSTAGSLALRAPTSPVDTRESAGDVQDPDPGSMSPIIALPLYGIFVFGLASALPFLSLPEGIIGLVIIGVALLQAWKLNKRPKLELTGPFEATPSAASPAALPARIPA